VLFVVVLDLEAVDGGEVNPHVGGVVSQDLEADLALQLDPLHTRIRKLVLVLRHAEVVFGGRVPPELGRVPTLEEADRADEEALAGRPGFEVFDRGFGSVRVGGIGGAVVSRKK